MSHVRLNRIPGLCWQKQQRKADLVECRIPLTSHKPLKQRLYPSLLHMQQTVKEETCSMADLGVIKSESPATHLMLWWPRRTCHATSELTIVVYIVSLFQTKCLSSLKHRSIWIFRGAEISPRWPCRTASVRKEDHLRQHFPYPRMDSGSSSPCLLDWCLPKWYSSGWWGNWSRGCRRWMPIPVTS